MASSRHRPPVPAPSSADEGAWRTRENAENFPVALRFLPRQHRDHLHAIYAYARMVDEIGDAFTGDRTARLREVAADLGTIWSGGQPSDAILRKLALTVRERGMSAEPFERLIEANLLDQVVSRYETFDDLRGYCALSADPVGRMVLEILGPARRSRVPTAGRSPAVRRQ
jgi:phytoene/squalene synthetase